MARSGSATRGSASPGATPRSSLPTDTVLADAAETAPTAPGRVVRVAPAPRKARPPAKAVSADTRIHNRTLVMRTLYRTGPMSRSDLARTSSLTRPTVSALVAELIDDGLVRDIGHRTESRVGKPATLVNVEPRGASIIALDLSGATDIVGVVTDLRGAVVARTTRKFPAAMGDAAVRTVLSLVDRLTELAPSRVLGIGIASPGIIDDEGLVRYATHLKWIDVPLAATVREHAHVPTFVGNDINTAAIAALHFRTPSVRDLIVVSITGSVGMGVVVGGKLIEGENFAAGEIGHVTVDDRGATCVCGRRGCLETYIRAARAAAGSRAPAPAGHSGPGALPADAATGDTRAALRAAGRAIGVVIAPIATALNLSHVFIAGAGNLVTGDLIDAATSTTAARTIPVINTSVKVVPLADDADLLVQGAAARVLTHVLGVL